MEREESKKIAPIMVLHALVRSDKVCANASLKEIKNLFSFSTFSVAQGK